VYTEIAKVPPRSVQKAQFLLKLQMRIVTFLKVGELCLICARVSLMSVPFLGSTISSILCH
jgi:hypothetical protein